MNAIKLQTLTACAMVVSAPSGCASPPSTLKAAVVAVDPDALLGAWSLKRIGADQVSRGLSLRFERRGIFSGTIKCNTIGGRYQVLGHRLILTGEIITTAGCAGWPEVVDHAERTLFSPATEVAMSADRRRLYVRGEESLIFDRIH